MPCLKAWSFVLIRSSLQVLVRLVGADDHSYPNSTDVLQWLADSNLLEMIVDKLSPSVSAHIVVLNSMRLFCLVDW